MATIYIHDTGLLTTTSSTAVSGSGNISNNGDEIPLKIRTLKFNVGMSFDNSPQPGSLEHPKLAFISIPSPIITLSGQINRKGDVSAAGNVINKIHEGTPDLTDESGTTSLTDEVKMLGMLEQASRTKGYKELYYKDNTANNFFIGMASWNETTKEAGSDTMSTESSGAYPCFNVRVKSFNLTETPDSNLIVWNCTLEVTR